LGKTVTKAYLLAPAISMADRGTTIVAAPAAINTFMN
jgi:hypothetical protein